MFLRKLMKEVYLTDNSLNFVVICVAFSKLKAGIFVALIAGKGDRHL